MFQAITIQSFKLFQQRARLTADNPRQTGWASSRNIQFVFGSQQYCLYYRRI